MPLHCCDCRAFTFLSLNDFLNDGGREGGAAGCYGWRRKRTHRAAHKEAEGHRRGDEILRAEEQTAAEGGTRFGKQTNLMATHFPNWKDVAFLALYPVVI